MKFNEVESVEKGRSLAVDLIYKQGIDLEKYKKLDQERKEFYRCMLQACIDTLKEYEILLRKEDLKSIEVVWKNNLRKSGGCAVGGLKKSRGCGFS